MSKNNVSSHLNDTAEFVSIKSHPGSVRLWKKIEMNEWTFSFILFAMSLSIVLGKLFINYGDIFLWQNNKYPILLSSLLSNISDAFGALSIPSLSTLDIKRSMDGSERFVNVSAYYEEVFTSVVTSFCKTYGWLIRATVCGLIMMGFTWFIIYKDSSIPGVNPPFPFSPSKRPVPEGSSLQINYLIGVLNGVLIFLYMCL